MDAIRIKASPEDIKRVAGDISGLAEKFSEYTVLLGQASDVSAAWGGDGSAEFTAKIQECLQELKRMSGILEETGVMLTTQGQNYESAQEQNKLNAQKLMG